MDNQIRKVVRRQGMEVEATLEMTINAPIGAVFDFVAAEDVLSTVRRHTKFLDLHGDGP